MRVARMYSTGMATLSTPGRRTQQERRATTRAALLAAASELFTERGFAGTGREDIAERAGVTRGALYHHFDSKTAAFVAVVDELEAELLDRVVAAARRGTTPFEQLQQARRAYMDACAEPAVARILLTDAPAVLGMAECRARDAASCGRLLGRALDDGLDLPGERDIGVALLLGLLNEGAAFIASSPNPRRERRRVPQPRSTPSSNACCNGPRANHDWFCAHARPHSEHVRIANVPAHRRSGRSGRRADLAVQALAAARGVQAAAG